MIPPGPIPMMQPNYSSEDEESCISADSSIHKSDYDSEDSSFGGFGASARDVATDETSTLSKTSLESMSLSTIGSNNVPRRSPNVEILSAADTSSSSSSDDDGWKTETSSASNVSSTGDNSSKYDEPRRHLQSRQKLRRTISNSTGSQFERPIDVENLKYHHTKPQPNDQEMAAWITRQRLGFGDNDSLSHTEAPSVAHRIVGFATAVGRKQLLQGLNGRQSAIPQEVPVPRDGDNISAKVGCIPSYRDLVRIVSQRKGSTDIEKGREPTMARHDRITGDRVAHRSDFELFLIVVIAVSLVTLVVLLGLLLKARR